jgi:pyruvate dehydrogenase E1 component alpha subunit
VFFGDSATEEGVTSESLNFSALKKLPIIFFCENNFYSVQSPLATRQPQRELYKWAASFGIPSVQVDGTNVLEVYDATREAVKRARASEGPTFIEALVYRFRAHGGAGDDSHTGYRDPAERQAWEEMCPVETYFKFLANADLIDAVQRDRMHADIVQEVVAAFDYALASRKPEETDLYTHVYSD